MLLAVYSGIRHNFMRPVAMALGADGRLLNDSVFIIWKSVSCWNTYVYFAV